MLKRLEFRDTHRVWRLHPFSFHARMNLLVGVSGAGKTRILQVLRAIRQTALGDSGGLHGCEWGVEIGTSEGTYRWTARTGSPEGIELPPAQLTLWAAERRPPERFLAEEISVDGEVLVRRTEDTFVFQGGDLPRLKDTESAVSLLGDEPRMAPLRYALERFVLSVADKPLPTYVYQRRERSGLDDLEALRESRDFSLLEKAYFLQREHPQEFRRLTESYSDIFETVQEVRIGSLVAFDPGAEGRDPLAEKLMTFGIRERNVDGWVEWKLMSSGMARTLIHLLELALAPRGTVLLIDEYENSLGVNCLPALTEHIQRSSGELQFVLTSHHPYVIENIPREAWKVVTRRGAEVRVRDAEDFPVLTGRSRQDAFVRLLNSEAFSEGIA